MPLSSNPLGMPFTYGNPRRNFLASIFLTPSPDYYGFGTSARPSSVATAMRRGGDDYNLYSASGSGSSRYPKSYSMRSTRYTPPPPKINYQTEKLYTDREASAHSATTDVTDVTQSSWAIRARERQGYSIDYPQRAPSTDRASSVDRYTSMERWKPVQDIRPSRINLSSHRFSEPVTLIDTPVPETMYARSSSLAPRMSPMPAYSPKRTYY